MRQRLKETSTGNKGQAGRDDKSASEMMTAHGMGDGSVCVALAWEVHWTLVNEIWILEMKVCGAAGKLVILKQAQDDGDGAP